MMWNTFSVFLLFLLVQPQLSAQVVNRADDQRRNPDTGKCAEPGGAAKSQCGA
jgi:hypothetical protein